MDFISREQARADIIALGLPQIVLDAFDGKPLPYGLNDEFHEPYQLLDEPAEQANYGQGRITPIWTGSGDYSIVAYDHHPTRKGFMRFDIETPETIAESGLSWQQVLVSEFKFLWESEWSNEQLREVAGWFEFDCIDLLIDELESVRRETFEKDRAWYQAFLPKIGN